MKQKDKISLIKDALKDLTPEIDKKFILDKANTTIFQEKKKIGFKIFTYAGSLATIFIIGFIIILSGKNIMNKDGKLADEKDSVEEDYCPEDDSPYSYPGFEKIGFSGITVVSLFENNFGNIDYSNENKNIEFINKYIKTFEEFRGYYRQSYFNKKVSDLNDYSNMITYSTIGLYGQLNNYKIYYNEEISNILVKYNNKDYDIEVSKDVINNKTVYNFIYDNENNKILLSAFNNKTFEVEIYSNNVLLNLSSIALNDYQLILKDLSTNKNEEYYINFLDAAYSNKFVIKYKESQSSTVYETGSINVSLSSQESLSYYYLGNIGNKNIDINVGKK